MRRRISCFTPIFLIVALLLAACGGGGTGNSGGNNGISQVGLTGGNSYINCPSSTNTTAAAPESGTVTLTVSGFSSTPAEDALVVQNLHNFEALHPNIKVNWSPIPGDYPTKMRANIASNTVPDVFYLQPSMSSEYISAGKLLNLSPYMTHDNVAASEYYSTLINPFTCTNGQIFGLPKDWSSLGLFYNKQMFQAAGLAAPSAGWTWSDMQTDAQKLTQNPGTPHSVYGAVLSADLSRWGAILDQANGSVLNKNGSQATFNNAQGVQAMEFYDSFFKNNTAAMPTSVGAGWNGDAFGQQRAAMVMEGSWLVPYMTTTYPKVQYGIAPLPIGPNGQPENLSFTNAWSAYSGTKHPEAAWELVKYMTGAAVQKVVLDDGFALPTLKSLANDPYFASHPDLQVLFNAAAYSHADYYGPQDSSIHTDVSNAIQEVLLGKQSIQTALNNAATQVNTQLQGG